MSLAQRLATVVVMTTPGAQAGGHSHGTLLPRLLELDAEVHSAVLDEAIGRIVELSGGPERVGRVVDGGAGVGTGTVALARHFPSAEIVALDVDEQMLAKVRSRALAEGLTDRIDTLRADLAGDSLPVDSVDVVWASAALHEVDDAGAALRNLFGVLVPGGWLAVLEMDAPPFLLPASYSAWEAELRTAGAIAAPDHPDRAASLSAAGFDSIEAVRIESDQVLPASGPAGEYAELELRRIGHVVMSALSEGDRSRLRTLAGGGVRDLGELWVRGTRTLWTARRPA